MNLRYRVVPFIFVVFFLLVISRLFYWQVVRADELAALGQAQYGKEVKLTPVRGEILTSDGFAMAANKLVYRVFANPKEVKNINEEAGVLSSLLDLDEASISALLA